MDEKKIRLIVKLNPSGGVTLSSTDLAKTASSHLRGKATSAQEVVADLLNLGLSKEAHAMRRERWPENGIKILVYILPDTELVMDALGFRDFGTIEKHLT